MSRYLRLISLSPSGPRRLVACRTLWKRYSLFVDPISALTQKKVEFSEDKHLGYSCEQVYDVVLDVDSYKAFLPWCQESRYVRRTTNKSIAKLSIGFPPLMEAYTALVLTEHPRSIRTISTDGRMFSHLENRWRFKEGPLVNGQATCLLHFYVCFEFRSAVTARLGMIVFDEVARMMAGGFETRCRELLGPSIFETPKGQEVPIRSPEPKTADCYQPSNGQTT